MEIIPDVSYIVIASTPYSNSIDLDYAPVHHHSRHKSTEQAKEFLHKIQQLQRAEEPRGLRRFTNLYESGGEELVRN